MTASSMLIMLTEQSQQQFILLRLLIGLKRAPMVRSGLRIMGIAMSARRKMLQSRLKKYIRRGKCLFQFHAMEQAYYFTLKQTRE